MASILLARVTLLLCMEGPRKTGELIREGETDRRDRGKQTDRQTDRQRDRQQKESMTEKGEILQGRRAGSNEIVKNHRNPRHEEKLGESSKTTQSR